MMHSKNWFPLPPQAAAFRPFSWEFPGQLTKDAYLLQSYLRGGAGEWQQHKYWWDPGLVTYLFIFSGSHYKRVKFPLYADVRRYLQWIWSEKLVVGDSCVEYYTAVKSESVRMTLINMDASHKVLNNWKEKSRLQNDSWRMTVFMWF